MVNMSRWICILFLGVAVSAPADEFRNLVNEGDLSINDESYRMQIVPSGYSPQKVEKPSRLKLTDFISQDNENYKTFNNLFMKGYAMKGLTFNIYDSTIRDTAIALFRVLKEINPDNIKLVKEWAKQNMNDDIFDYALRLAALYGNNIDENEIQPPFIYKPNFFINSETIVKALKLRLNNGQINPQEAAINQIRSLRDGNVVTINTNYSGWVHPINKCDKALDYFREDIFINSYYYGLHLQHPFWMSNEELDDINPRHAEHYLFSIKQLLARYNLEKQHLLQEDQEINEDCDIDYRPFLLYDNGLAFPNRPSFFESQDISREKFISIDIALKECLSRRIIMLSNGTIMKINEDNYLQLLPKLLRANLDGVSSGEAIRNLFGYGNGEMNVNTPAPSVIHQYQTSLRDRVYWVLLQRALNYSLDFLKDMGPYNLESYETSSIRIVNSDIHNFISFFDYYQLNINNALGNNKNMYMPSPQIITARQMRLQHIPFQFTFNVNSELDQNAVMRLFLGPRCYKHSCWNNYNKFFEMDSFVYRLKQGLNNITWSPEQSPRFSFDDLFNLEKPLETTNDYNMFKFPANLLIPKGSEDGLPLSMFVIITPTDTLKTCQENNEYNKIAMCLEVDEKPLGFPFHRLAVNHQESASNYRFFNVSVYHHKRTVNAYGLFSDHLY